VTRAWTAVIATTNYGSTRTYGTSVLLPLSSSNGYKSRVMILGGGNPSTATTEIIDFSQATPAWQYGPSMSQPRIEMNATILPNGKILATGGSLNDEDAATASFNADLYDPKTNTFSSAGANAYPRLYHSGALLLPDATVMLAGGNPARGSYEQHIEIYSPSYLFDVNGAPAARPTITSVSSNPISYGGGFQVQTPEAADIASVVLVRPGAPTHAFDMDQRLVELDFTAGSGVLNVTGPPNGNVAPPGYYMLFVLNAAGVPSLASFVRLASLPPNQPPAATITDPSSNVTVNPGGSVYFAGSGSDPDGTITGYSWTFPNAVPASSTAATPGNVIYSTPGTSSASLVVTDNSGAQSAAVARSVTVSDFSVSASPSSATIAPGSTAGYTAAISPINGFTGSVGFSVTGLPSGTTASFSPDSLTTSGSSDLSVVTTATTPPGTYTLTIRGTSGPVSHTANVTLVVLGTYTVGVTPATRTIARGGAATYTVTVASQGFSGTVTLSTSALPRAVTAKFSPGSITNAGTSTLTLDSKKNVVRGTYNLTVRATFGSQVQTAPLVLVVQ
jgi:hypothetical protein